MGRSSQGVAPAPRFRVKLKPEQRSSMLHVEPGAVVRMKVQKRTGEGLASDPPSLLRRAT